MNDSQFFDKCRICRSEALPDNPLFHPCKCRGSIEYFHQDCLVQWLEYSKKEYCELCNHRFSFIPIYSPDMPKRLPIRDIISDLFGSLVTGVRYWIHYSGVAVAWLGTYSLIAYLTYRRLFGNSINSVLTLLLNMFSTENISDGLNGCGVVTCILSAFISLIWLREQILGGGDPESLEQQLNAHNVVPQIQNQINQNNGNNEAIDDDNNDNNDEGIGDESDDEDTEEDTDEDNGDALDGDEPQMVNHNVGDIIENQNELQVADNHNVVNGVPNAQRLCRFVVNVSLNLVFDIKVLPIVNGWLDICSLPMLKIPNKITNAPVTSLFIHWLVEMVYVFHFAPFILLLREVLRPGGLTHINLILMRQKIPVMALGLILVIPYIAINRFLPIFNISLEMQNILNRRIHPLLLFCTAVIYLIHWQIHKFYRLYERIKNNYLVGRRLVNYDPIS